MAFTVSFSTEIATADLQVVDAFDFGAASLAVTLSAAVQAGGDVSGMTVAIEIVDEERIGMNTGTLDMALLADRNTLINTVSDTVCTGLVGTCSVTIAQRRVRSRALAAGEDVELDVSKIYDYSGSTPPSAPTATLISNALMSVGVNVTSSTRKKLSMTSTITQRGSAQSSTLDDNFPTQADLGASFSVQMPSVSTTVSSTTIATPPRPPPSPPPSLAPSSPAGEPTLPARDPNALDEDEMVSLIVGTVAIITVLTLIVGGSLLIYIKRFRKPRTGIVSVAAKIQPSGKGGAGRAWSPHFTHARPKAQFDSPGGSRLGSPVPVPPAPPLEGDELQDVLPMAPDPPRSPPASSRASTPSMSRERTPLTTPRAWE